MTQREDFEAWWTAHCYDRVVVGKAVAREIAFDSWQAALAQKEAHRPPDAGETIAEHEPENEPFVSLASVQSEPVAYYTPERMDGFIPASVRLTQDRSSNATQVPLYTTPPNHRAVLRQALEALEEATSYTSCQAWSPSMTEECNAAIAEIREVLK